MFTRALALSAQAMVAVMLLPTAVTLTAASPLMKHEVEELPSLIQPDLERRQSSGPYTAVTGVTGFGSQPRLEIRQLEKNVDQFNLYILGLDRFMKADESQKLSYYQIAGTVCLHWLCLRADRFQEYMADLTFHGIMSDLSLTTLKVQDIVRMSRTSSCRGTDRT